MARSTRNLRGVRRATALSVWLYSLCLCAYPATFRHLYGERMVRVFRDSCRDTMQQRGVASLVPLWLQTLSDLVFSACAERWRVFKQKGCSMDTYGHPRHFPLRLWVALAATVIAFVVSLVASLNLYLLEDASPLTPAAYSSSSLLRFSYDGVYLSALAAAVAVCAIVGYTLLQRNFPVVVGLVVVTLLVAIGGFGGLLVKHAVTFLVLLAVFCTLTLSSFLLGRVVTSRSGRVLGQRASAVLGACVSVGSMVLVNFVALLLHTLSLNPVSHALYMQGQIEGTHLNFTLLVMGLAFLTLIACMVCLGRALRPPSHQL
jgi:hypothetical protein